MDKFDIAEEQLIESINLYIDGKSLVSALTLAGAAEEILGKLVKNQGLDNALNQKVADLCELHELCFGEKPDPKTYLNLRNNARNEAKHLCSGKPMNFDIDEEAASLIHRSIENRRILRPGYVQLFKDFEITHIKRTNGK